MYIVYYVDIIGSVVLLRCKCAILLFLLILCSHKRGIIPSHFHASVFSLSLVSTWWRKMDMLNVFYNSCDTMIWLSITPIKVGIGVDWYNPHLYYFFCLLVNPQEIYYLHMWYFLSILCSHRCGITVYRLSCICV